MSTSVLSNSLQEEDNTLQNNLNTNDKSNLEIKGDISDDAIFEDATNVKLTPDVSEEVEIKEVEDDDSWMFEGANEVAEPSASETAEEPDVAEEPAPEESAPEEVKSSNNDLENRVKELEERLDKLIDLIKNFEPGNLTIYDIVNREF